jgi:hypothetical protein
MGMGGSLLVVDSEAKPLKKGGSLELFPPDLAKVSRREAAASVR